MSALSTCPNGHSWLGDTSCPECGAASIDSAAATVSAPGGTVPTTPTVPQPALVPGYEILGELGRGGMGVVYQARQLRADRIVALKMILSGGHASPTELERFQNEARAIARLAHPHIVQVYEVGTHAGVPYFSLEFCPGGSLDKKLARTPQPARAAAALVEQLARAVHTAHEAGILHRDLKPANVLLAADGSPRITDFGLAKKLDEVGQTHTGKILGTPAYMAPEQAQGRVHDLGPACDVWALGAILYECLTGQAPFRGPTVARTLALVCETEPAAPRKLHPSIPRDLETICLKCLRKEPEKRYGSALALADDLSRWLAGEPILARPVGRIERALLWARRRPTQAALVVATTLVVVLGGLVAATVALWRFALTERDNVDLLRGELKVANDTLERLNYVWQLRVAQSEVAARDFDRARDRLDGLAEHLRGWEWHYLRNVLDGSEVVLRAHGRGTIGLQYSARSGRLLSLSWDEAKIRSPKGDLLATLRLTDRVFLSAAIDPAGETVAVCAMIPPAPKEAVKIELRVHALDGKLLRAFPLKSNAPALAYSPDGRWFAAGDYDGLVQLWDAATWERGPAFRGNQVEGIAFSPDSRWLAIATGDPGIYLWEPATQTSLALKGITVPLAPSFSRDGRTVFAVDGTGAVHAWERGRPGSRVVAAATKQSFRSVGALPSGVVVLANNRQLVLRDGTRTWSPGGHTAAIRWLAVAPDGSRIATAATDNTQRLWTVTAAPPVVARREFLAPGVLSHLSTDGERIGTLNQSFFQPLTYRIIDLAGRTLSQGEVRSAVSNAAAWSADLQWIATGDESGGLLLTDTTPGRPARRLPAGPRKHPIKEIHFGPEDRHLAAWGNEVLTVWDVAAGGALFSKPVPGLRSTELFAPTDTLAFAPDGHLFAHSNEDVVVLCRIADGGEVRRFAAGRGRVNAIAFSPDGRELALAGSARGVTFWDVATAVQTGTLAGESQSVRAIAYSPDGTRLATATRDSRTRLWSRREGQELLTWEPPEMEIAAHNLHWSRDGRRLFWRWQDRVYLADGSVNVGGAAPPRD